MKDLFDLKDKKILYELDLNSRQSFQSIGKKVGLSKNGVKYRIDNFLKKGIIKQFHTVIDVNKIGYTGFRLYVSLKNISPEKEKEIIQYLINQKIVVWIVSIEGEYNLGVLMLTKSIEEIRDFWKKFSLKYINFLGKRLISIVTGVRYFSRSFIRGLKLNNYEVNFVSGSLKEKNFDKKDLEILKLLASNSRRSIVEISFLLKMNEKTVLSRIRKLEKKKIIIGYKTVFNLEKFGYLYYKINFQLQNVTFKNLSNLKNYIKNHPNIIYEDEILGGEDIEIELQVKDTNQLRQIIEEIKEKFSKIIWGYSILLFYKEHKYLFFPIK